MAVQPLSVKKSLAWLGLAQGISIALQFSSSVVLARHLTPYDMGIFAVAFATVSVLSIFQQLGLNAFIVREEVLTDDISRTAFTINALITTALSIAIVAASYVGAVFLRDDGVRWVLLVLAVTPLFGIISFLPASNLERNGRFREIAVIGTVSGVIGAGTTIILAVLGFSYMSVAYAQLISSAFLALMLSITGRQYFSCKTGFSAWRRVASFGFQMLATSGINTGADRLSEIMLGRILGLGPLGLYNRASGLSGLIWNSIHVAAGRVILVDFAGLHRQGIPLIDRYKKTVGMVTATLWPAYAGMAVVAKPFITIVYGPQWVSAVAPFAFIALAAMIHVAIAMSWEVFTATGHLKLQTNIEFKRALLSFTLFVGGCLISLNAAAASRVIEAMIAVILYRPHINRITGTTFSDFKRIYLQSAFLTILAIAPSTALMLSSANSGSPLMLGLAIALGITLWIFGLFALKHSLADEIKLTMARLYPS
jgi:O-antigen/teichoic acid export membrane protein